MTQTTQEWNVDALGRWTDTLETVVSRESTIAYAKATNSTIADQLAGSVAPPVYAIVPPFGQLAAAMIPIVPQDLLLRVVHGEQDMRFHRPIVPGMTLCTRIAGVGIHTAPGGIMLHSRIETTTPDGALVNEQSTLGFFRGAPGEVDVGERAPAHRTAPDAREAEPLATVVQTFDADQTFRYAEASGDHMPIHLDDDVARSVGLPGIIIHGLCTMAFNSDAIVERCCDGDTARLRRLAVRFSRPNLPGQTMTTRIWRVLEPPADGVRAYAFEATDDAGDVVIKDGLAEVDG